MPTAPSDPPTTSAPPAAPSRLEPNSFRSRTDAFLDWLEGVFFAFQTLVLTYIRDTATQVYDNTVESNAAAGAANTKAGEAAASLVSIGAVQSDITTKVGQAQSASLAADGFADDAANAGGLPALAGNADTFLRVNATEDGFDWSPFELDLTLGSSSGSTQDVDWNNDVHKAVASSSPVTFTFSNVAATDKISLVIEDQTGGADVTALEELQQVGLSSSSVFSSCVGLRFSADGMYLFNTHYLDDELWRHTLPAPYDLSSIVTQQVEGLGNTSSYSTWGFDFGDGGNKCYFVRLQNTGIKWIYEYDVTDEAYGIVLSYVDRLDINATCPDAQSLRWNDDGTRLWVLNGNTETLFQFSVSTPWDILTATPDVGATATFAGTSNLTDFAFTDDFGKCIAGEESSGRAATIILNTPGDLAGGFTMGPIEQILPDGNEDIQGLDVINGGAELMVLEPGDRIVRKFKAINLSFVFPAGFEGPSISPQSVGGSIVLDIVTTDGGATSQVANFYEG